ncbi:MAG: helix-turn-helix transcriptional regulator [Usitatibacter sp.]
MKRARNTTKVEAGSGNVYADLGLEDSERMLVKARLTAAIAAIIASRGLTQGAAAELLGLTQPILSNLLRGRFRGVSERRLMDCLTRLGRDVVIVIKDKPRSRGSGRVSVHES